MHPNYTLRDAYNFLVKIKSNLIREIKQFEFDKILIEHPLTKEPPYQSVKVYLDQNKLIPIHLLHSNLGYIYFNNGDILDTFKLDKKEFYFDFQINNYPTKYHRDDIQFTSSGEQNWNAIFDYEEIFDHFGLSGKDDFAPFVGFYIVD